MCLKKINKFSFKSQKCIWYKKAKMALQFYLFNIYMPLIYSFVNLRVNNKLKFSIVTSRYQYLCFDIISLLVWNITTRYLFLYFNTLKVSSDIFAFYCSTSIPVWDIKDKITSNSLILDNIWHLHSLSTDRCFLK